MKTTKSVNFALRNAGLCILGSKLLPGSLKLRAVVTNYPSGMNDSVVILKKVQMKKSAAVL
jgi:hypothetical protein